MAELVHASEADVERLSAEVAALRKENETLRTADTHQPASRRARVAVGAALGVLLSFSAFMVFLSVMPLD